MNRRSFFKCLTYPALAAIPTLGYLSFAHIPNCLEVNTYDIEVENWNKDLEKLKIVFFSDNHTDGVFGTMFKLRRIIDSINAQNPDIVFFGGDIARGRASPNYDMKEIAKEFKRIKSNYGTFCVYGNHDWGYGAYKIKKLFETSNLKFFENESVEIFTKYGNFKLVTLADSTMRYVNFYKAFKGVGLKEPTIVLSHSPDPFPACPRQFSIMLAGHTHGGQIDLPFIGPLLVPSIYGKKYAKGLITENNKTLYVTHGCGSATLFARFPTKPEIAVLKLKAKSGA